MTKLALDRWMWIGIWAKLALGVGDVRLNSRCNWAGADVRDVPLPRDRTQTGRWMLSCK